MTSIAHFDSLADYADRAALQPYEGKKQAWILVNRDNLSLGEVANAFYHGVAPTVEEWVVSNAISVHQSLHEIPGDDWMVVWFEDCYFMKSVT